SVRLKSANPSRVSFPDRDEPDRAKDRYITQCDRRLDALARLLVGDEVCAAVAFDGDHTLYVATNNDGHFMSTFQCPLWTSIFTLWQHLAPISHMSSDISHPILYTEFTEDVRNNFVKEALPYLLIAPNSSLYADTATKKKKLDDQKINPLREFSRKLSSDFYRFETSASEDGFGEDLVERWIENLRPRLHTLSPPSFVVKSETDIADFYDTITQFFRDLLKIEKFFFTTDHKDPRAKTLVDAMGRGGGHEDALRFEMIDEGGKGVHAEMRLIAHFRMIEGKKIPYIGISRLCCAYCNVVMEHVLGVRCFELEDDVLVPTRGHHAVSFPWPIHEKLRSSEEFLQRFLGNNLYAQYRSMKGRSIDYPGISHQDRGEFALIILENLPRLSFNPASKAVAEKLGIFFPEGDRKHQIADPSIAFSETPTYFHTRKAFFLFDGRRYVDEGTDEFDRLQQLNSRSRRAALIDLPAKIGNEGLLYTGDHIHYILERHYLSENTAFTVIPPA
ncbi:MAG: hypothetical protein NT094_04250, partial [Candidatus Staskawiczbacteria bacterium]|nr:hypothetical protein [Candidatus Staskawiczbacteria bacterium]